MGEWFQMAKKNRVLFIIGSLREGGAEAQLVHLVRGLHGRGWPVAVMVLRREGVRLGEVEALGVPLFDVGLPRFRPRWNPLPWLRLPVALLRSVRWMRRWRPGVIHGFLFWSHVWAWLCLLLLPRRIRLVTSRRQTSSDKRDSRLLTALENRINRRAAVVVSNSRAGAVAALRKETNLPPVVVIPNGVDLDRMDEAAPADLRALFPPLGQCTRIAITVANLLPHKGYDDLLEAWARVIGVIPSAGLVCVGADGGLLGRLQRKAKRLGIESNIVFAGSRRDVPSLIKGADFAVHASHDEGLPNAVMEYMACGRAVVATGAGGTGELVRHWKEGYLVAPGGADVLAERILDLVICHALCRRFGEAGRRRIEKRFGLDRMISRSEELYRRVGRGEGRP